MLPPTCFTCGRLFADIQDPYEKDIAEIEHNAKLTDAQKTEIKAKLLDKYHIHNYCCRMRVLTYVKLVEIIV